MSRRSQIRVGGQGDGQFDSNQSTILVLLYRVIGSPRRDVAYGVVVARDALNFSVCKMVVTTVLIAALVCGAAFWPGRWKFEISFIENAAPPAR